MITRKHNRPTLHDKFLKYGLQFELLEFRKFFRTQEPPPAVSGLYAYIEAYSKNVLIIIAGSDVLVLTSSELPVNRRRIRLKLKSSSISVLSYDANADVIDCPPAA